MKHEKKWIIQALFQLYCNDGQQTNQRKDGIKFDSQLCFKLGMTFQNNKYQINQLIFMEHVKAQQIQCKQFGGSNFYGKISVKQDKLTMDITQFKKGGFYVYEVTNLNLEKQLRRYLIFKKVQDLFGELVSNAKLEISDENTLIMPTDVIYKGKTIELKVEVPLIQRKFNSQTQKLQHLFEQFQKYDKSIKNKDVNILNQQKIKMQQQLQLAKQKLIAFKGDEKNQKFKSFQLLQNSTKVKMIGGANQFINFNHYKPLGKQGVFFFKIKIIKTAYNYIMVGICAQQIKSIINSHITPHFMGIYLANNYLYANGKNIQAFTGHSFMQGSVIKVEINMERYSISWFDNNVKLYQAQIGKDLINMNVYPVFNMYTNGDIIELIDE